MNKDNKLLVDFTTSIKDFVFSLSYSINNQQQDSNHLFNMKLTQILFIVFLCLCILPSPISTYQTNKKKPPSRYGLLIKSQGYVNVGSTDTLKKKSLVIPNDKQY